MSSVDLFAKAFGWKVMSFFARRGSGASLHGSSTLRHGHWPGLSGHGLHGHRSAALLGDHLTQHLEDSQLLMTANFQCIGALLQRPVC